MLSRRVSLHGLLAVLLALVAQLGMGAGVPRVDIFAQLVGAEAPLCHAADERGTNPAQPPIHPADCLLNRRVSLHGLLAVLLALVAQLGVGATVPRVDVFAQFVGAEAPLCHAADERGTNPSQPPSHPADCLVCPFCIAVHAPAATLICEGAVAMNRSVVAALRPELPPPSTAPPYHRLPSQPRAPPIYS